MASKIDKGFSHGQIEGEVIHVITHSLHNMNHLMRIDSGIRDLGYVDKPAKQNTSAEIFTKPIEGELFPSRGFK